MIKPVIHFPLRGNLENIGSLRSTVTVSGTIAPSPAQGGCAFNDGWDTTSRVLYDFRPEMNFHDMSIALHLCIDANNSRYPYIVSQDWYDGFSVEIASIVDGVFIVSFSAKRSYIEVANILADEWVHLAFTRSGSTHRAYKNGLLIEESVGNATVLTSEYGLGLFNSPDFDNFGAEQFKGYLKDVRIYDYALSSVQVAHIANGLMKDKSNV